MGNKNLPAFPIVKQMVATEHGEQEIPATEGLSKREWFAGMALQGLLAARGNDPNYSYLELVSDAISTADSIIEQLDN